MHVVNFSCCIMFDIHNFYKEGYTRKCKNTCNFINVKKNDCVFIFALGASLFASCLLQKLSKVADDEEEFERSLALKQNSS